MASDGPTAYTPYDLIRHLIEQVGWPVESEKQLAREAVAQWERMQIFGNLAQMIACTHPQEAINPRTGGCLDCGTVKPTR